ncbi:MAG: ferrous iron transporter B [Candidatus Omnitrophica bacterium]|nr:ferrous iron transporter B [Candidatus Omnitrophota bacterium]
MASDKTKLEVKKNPEEKPVEEMIVKLDGFHSQFTVIESNTNETPEPANKPKPRPQSVSKNNTKTLVKKVAIIGLPNTGKSQIFNNLTGEYNIVANYPRTTIEVKRSLAKIKEQLYEIIDTPSLHCLYIHSEEEMLVRNMILDENPDIIVQCIDASQYKQSLLLTADLLELETPMVIVLNAIDKTQRKGIRIDSKELERILEIPVVESIATRSIGKAEIQDAITKARKSKSSIKYGFKIESAIIDVMSALPFEMPFKFKASVLLLLMDPFLEKSLEKKHGREMIERTRLEISRIRRQSQDKIHRDINSKRHQWVSNISNVTVKKDTPDKEFSQDFARACRHPVLGIPILLLFLSFVYLSVVYISTALTKFLEVYIVTPTVDFIQSLSLPLFWNDLLIGQHGIITLGVFNALCTVLPIISVFFFVFGFFEDSGYISNFCVLTKRLFEKIGVTGKAITSFVLGFACKTMATLNTKCLPNRKEKLITVFLISFAIPCSSQLGLDLAILSKVGITAFLIAFGTLTFYAVLAGVILNKVLKDDLSNCFIEVIPPMHLPSIKGIALKTYHRMISFLKESMPIFVLSAIVLFAVDKLGILPMIKKGMNPLIVSWMGLPSDILDVFMLSLATRSAAAGLIFNMVDSGALNFTQSIVAVVVTTTFLPCFSNIIAIGKEMGIKAAITISGAIVIVSFFLGGVLNWLLIFALKQI